MLQFRETVSGIFDKRQRFLPHRQQNSSGKLLPSQSGLYFNQFKFLGQNFEHRGAIVYCFHPNRNHCFNSLCITFYQYVHPFCFKKKINNKINYYDSNNSYPNVQLFSVHDLLTNRHHAHCAGFTISV